MTTTQIIVIVLIAAAFAAGWLLRKDPPAEPEAASMEPDTLRALLDAYANAARPDSGALARAELARRITEAEDECDRLLADRGADHPAVQAYDRLLNAVASLRRLLSDPGAGTLALRLHETELAAARDAWQQLPQD